MKYHAGDRVEHPDLGKGWVVKTDRKGITIDFPSQKGYYLTWNVVNDKIQPYQHVKEGDYVYHTIRGVGKVLRTTETSVDVKFQRETITGMAWKIAEKLEPIPADGLRAALLDDPDKIKQMVKEKPTDIVALVLMDFNRQARTDDIKRLLVQQKLLKPQQWDKWWRSVTPLLREDPHFDTSQSQRQIYALREAPKPLHEEIYERFLQQDQIENKLRIIKTLIEDHFDDLDDKIRAQCHTYLADQIMNTEEEKALRIQAYFLAEKLAQKSPQHGVPEAGEALFEGAVDVSKLLYTADAERVLTLVREKPNWADVYLTALEASAVRIRRMALKELVRAGKWEEINMALEMYAEQVTENPNTFTWLATELLTQHLKNHIHNMDMKLILYKLVNMLDWIPAGKSRENVYTLVVNRNILNRFIGEFDDNVVEKFLETYLTSSSIRIHDQEQVMDILEMQNRVHILETLSHYFEDALHSRKSMEKQKVTAAEYKEMEDRFEMLLMEELPKITREMAAAREEKGTKDSHYLTLWDKQRFLLTQIQRVREMLRMSEIQSS
ncbi:MAG: hypothetical protein D6675_10500 [Gemmatimonadetes bacterium]|nr:MAG: hypothetical protein D6675_10500 [Gemmatimonadota bacterium]